MASLVQRVVAPHAAHKEEVYSHDEDARAGTFTPDTLPPGARRVVDTVRALFRARTMSDYCVVMPALARDMVWDAPPILTGRKGHFRVATYLGKFAAALDFEPALVTVKHLAGNRHLLEISGTVRVQPYRTWLLPATLLLPASIPIRTTIKVGVNGSLSDGRIDLIQGMWHNLPSLPSPLRSLNGLAMGWLPHLAEPVWGRAMEFLGDDFYKRKRERAIADGTAGAVDQAIDLGENAVNNLGDVVSNLLSTVMDTTNRAMDTSRQYADTTMQSARDTARAAADTTAGVARSAYETVVPSDVTATMRKDMPMSERAGEATSMMTARAKDAANRIGAGLDPSGAQPYATQYATAR